MTRLLRCSFCRKNEEEVAKLVAGPNVTWADAGRAIATRRVAASDFMLFLPVTTAFVPNDTLGGDEARARLRSGFCIGEFASAGTASGLGVSRSKTPNAKVYGGRRTRPARLSYCPSWSPVWRAFLPPCAMPNLPRWCRWLDPRTRTLTRHWENYSPGSSGGT